MPEPHAKFHQNRLAGFREILSQGAISIHILIEKNNNFIHAAD